MGMDLAYFEKEFWDFGKKLGISTVIFSPNSKFKSAKLVLILNSDRSIVF
jgi:hypothetical protein